MTHGSLFSGIGGIDRGFQMAGIETLWDVEIEPYSQKVLKKNFPDTVIYNDVHTVGSIPRVDHLQPVDIISGGFPCQDISVAGKQEGIEGERSGLWSEFHRIISELRPRFVLIENVARLVSIRPGLDRVLCDLASIGYDAEWQIISANDVGAPHLRKRVWIIAYPQGPDDPQQDGPLESRGEDVEGRDTEVRSELGGLREAMADPSSIRREGIRELYPGKHGGSGGQNRTYPTDGGEQMADSKDKGLDGGERIEGDAQGESRSGGAVGTGSHGNRRSENVAHTSSEHDGSGNTREAEGQVQEPGESGSTGDVADPNKRGRKDRPGGGKNVQGRDRSGLDATDNQPETESSSSDVPDATVERLSNGGGASLADTGEEIMEPERQDSIRGGSQASSDSDSQRRRGRNPQRENAENARESSRREEQGPWNPEPEFRRVVDELSERLDKIGVEIANEEDEQFMVLGLMNACEELGRRADFYVEIPQIWDSMSENEQAWIVFRIAFWNPWWMEWPDVPRVATGIKKRGDRIKGLGNAVVPEIPYKIGMILQDMDKLSRGQILI